MNTQTRTDERTELDQRTKDDLAIVCDADAKPRDGRPGWDCAAPAEWIVLAAPHCAPAPRQRLLCTKHMAHWAMGLPISCVTCHATTSAKALTVEPLR